MWFDYTVCSSDTVCCTTHNCAHTTYKHSRIHAHLQSSQLVQHISGQQEKASYFPAMLPKAAELKQSYTLLPGPPSCRTQNGSQLKKTPRPQQTAYCDIRTPYLPSNPSWTHNLPQRKFWSWPGTHFAGSPSATRTSKWVLCVQQLKRAPTHPGSYTYRSADLSKSFCRIIAFTEQMGKKIHRYQTAFTFSCFCTRYPNPQHFYFSLVLFSGEKRRE